MQKQLILLISFLISFSSAFSQEKSCPHPGGMKGMRGKGREMMQEMNLSETQRTRMQEIRKDYRSKMDELEKNDKTSLKDYRSRQAALQQDLKKNMESVLTPEQKTKMSELKKNRREEGQVRMQKRLEKMKSNLSLTDEQYGRLQSSAVRMHSKVMAIHDDATLSMDQKKQQIRVLRATEREDMRSVLNPEQLKKMEEKKAGMRGPQGARGKRQGPPAK